MPRMLASKLHWKSSCTGSPRRSHALSRSSLTTSLPDLYLRRPPKAMRHPWSRQTPTRAITIGVAKLLRPLLRVTTTDHLPESREARNQRSRLRPPTRKRGWSPPSPLAHGSAVRSMPAGTPRKAYWLWSRKVIRQVKVESSRSFSTSHAPRDLGKHTGRCAGARRP